MCMHSQEGDTYREHMYALVPYVKFGLFIDDKNSNSNCNAQTSQEELIHHNSKHISPLHFPKLQYMHVMSLAFGEIVNFSYSSLSLNKPFLLMQMIIFFILNYIQIIRHFLASCHSLSKQFSFEIHLMHFQNVYLVEKHLFVHKIRSYDFMY